MHDLRWIREHPKDFDTGMARRGLQIRAEDILARDRAWREAQTRSQEAQAAEIARTPLRRVAEAADQAKVICFLASSDADFVTGVTIDVTGGN